MSRKVRSTRLGVLRQVLWQSLSSWYERDATTQAAALAFFALFSLMPVLSLVITIAGLAFGQDAVRGQIVRQFGLLMGRDQALAIEAMLRGTVTQSLGPFARVVGIGAFAVGTTAVFVQLQSSLNLMWNVEPRSGPLIRTLLVKRLVSFALVIAIGFVLLVSLALSAAIAALQDYLHLRWVISGAALDGANAVLSIGIFTVLFAMIYRILPDVEIPWKDVWLGSFLTALLVSVGKWAIGLYLGQAGLLATYGASASLVVILFWIYYASLLVLFGAVFTRVWSQRVIKEKRPPSAGARKIRVAKKEAPTA